MDQELLLKRARDEFNVVLDKPVKKVLKSIEKIDKLKNEIRAEKAKINNFKANVTTKLRERVGKSKSAFIKKFKPQELKKGTDEYEDFKNMVQEVNYCQGVNLNLEITKMPWNTYKIYRIDWNVLKALDLDSKFSRIESCDIYPERGDYVEELFAFWTGKAWIIYGVSELWKYRPGEQNDEGIGMSCEEVFNF